MRQVATFLILLLSISRSLAYDLSFPFRQNVGQWKSDVLFQSNSKNASIQVKDNALVFALRLNDLPQAHQIQANQNGIPEFRSKFLVWEKEFIGGNRQARIRGKEKTNSNVHWFSNIDAKAKNISEYKSLHIEHLYPGISATHYYHNGRLKTDYVIEPMSDYKAIKIKLKGIQKLSLDKKKRLKVYTKAGIFTEEIPLAYQNIQGKRRVVKCSYHLMDDSTYTFHIPKYDPKYELIIDPIYVDWSTYFYGTGRSQFTYAWTWINDLQIDNDLNVYVTGMTTDIFPSSSGSYDTSTNGSYDAFVCKMNASGDSVLYFTYLGGSGYDIGNSMGLTKKNQVVLSGITWSNNFPLVNAQDGSKCGNGFGYCYRGFVSKLSTNGDSLLFSTYFGGKTATSGYYPISSVRSLEIGPSGNIYLTGETNTTDFPITANALQSKFEGGSGFWYYQRDAFFSILNENGDSIIYSTYLGGSDNDVAHNLFVDPNKNVYIVGQTKSSNFYKSRGNPFMFNSSVKGGSDGFIVRFETDGTDTGTNIKYSYLFGGTGDESIEGVFANKKYEVYLAGYTSSSDLYTSSEAYQKNNKGGYDQFVLKIPSGGGVINYSTYLGGSGDDYFRQSTGWWYTFPNIRVSANIREEAIVCGISKSTDYPITIDALQTTNKSSVGGSSYWKTSSTIAKLDELGSKLIYGTYWGGSGYEYPGAIRVKRTNCFNNILYGGMTYSGDFPTTKGAYKEKSKGTYWSGFVSNFRDTLHIDPIQLSLADTMIECDQVFEILDAKNQGADILWSTGSKLRYIIHRDTGLLWVRATYGCDTTQDSIYFLKEYSPKDPELGSDTVFCNGFPMTRLDAKNDTIPKVEYLWNVGDTSQSIVAKEAGLYQVEVKTENCGSNTFSISLDSNRSPLANFLSDSIFCDSIQYPINPPVYKKTTYIWNLNDTQQAFTISDTGLYQLKLSNSCGIDSVQFNIKKYLSPVAKLPVDTTFCNEVSWKLKLGDSTNGESYLWQQNGIFVSSKKVFEAKNKGKIIGFIRNKCGNSIDSTKIKLLLNPVVNLGPDTFACNQVKLILNAGNINNEEEILWSTGDTQSQIQLQDSGWYSVQTKNICSTARDTIFVDLYLSPEFELGNDSIFCSQVNYFFDMEDHHYNQYVWSHGVREPSVNITDTGEFILLVLNKCASKEDRIRLGLQQTPSVDLDDDRHFCDLVSENISFSVGKPNNGESYIWSNGETGNKFQTQQEGEHWVQIKNKCGTASDTVLVWTTKSPSINLPPDTNLCGDFILEIKADVNPKNVVYQWLETGDALPYILVNQQGVYTLKVTDSMLCSTQAKYTVGEACKSYVFVPNAFSPNADGINDDFSVYTRNISDYHLQIFNRWGEQLFESWRSDESWDGSTNANQPSNTKAFYILRYFDEEVKNYKVKKGIIWINR